MTDHCFASPTPISKPTRLGARERSLTRGKTNQVDRQPGAHGRTGVVSAVGSCVRSVRPDNFHDLGLFKGLQAGKFPPAFAGERLSGSTRRLWPLLAHAARRVEIVTATS